MDSYIQHNVRKSDVDMATLSQLSLSVAVDKIFWIIVVSFFLKVFLKASSALSGQQGFTAWSIALQGRLPSYGKDMCFSQV